MIQSRQCGHNTTDCKGRAQQPAKIKELLTRKVGTVYRAVLEFWKEEGAPGTLALGTSSLTKNVPIPGTQHAEIQNEASST